MFFRVCISKHPKNSISAKLDPADRENALDNVGIEHFNALSHIDIEQSVRKAANALGLSRDRAREIDGSSENIEATSEDTPTAAANQGRSILLPLEFH
jgi:hypothetical protein